MSPWGRPGTQHANAVKPGAGETRKRLRRRDPAKPSLDGREHGLKDRLVELMQRRIGIARQVAGHEGRVVLRLKSAWLCGADRRAIWVVHRSTPIHT